MIPTALSFYDLPQQQFFYNTYIILIIKQRYRIQDRKSRAEVHGRKRGILFARSLYCGVCSTEAGAKGSMMRLLYCLEVYLYLSGIAAKERR